jgi:thiamine-phosphate diphosphorylase/hydroxyethylthiazole kinase
MSSKPKVDYSLYLVTDSTPAILGDKDIVQVVEQAILGGVTVVQYRDKHAETGTLISTAARLHAVTQKHNIPLLINDRLDVCQAVGAEGAHIGQDDISYVEARKILGPNAIIGVTASSVHEAEKAIQDGADYLGIGTTFATPTKQDTKSIIGTKGLQEILGATATGTEKSIPCVAIGSINATNVQRVLHQSAHGTNRLNGVAVVSAIVASSDPQASALELLTLIKTTPEKYYAAVPPGVTASTSVFDLLGQIPRIIKTHVTSSPLSHNMTNTVVQNFAANVSIATGGSPIMSENGPEAADLARLGGGLVINMGTATPEKLATFAVGLKAYNAVGSPVLLDPVGGGATAVRRGAIKTLLAAGFFSIIKGNEGEIGAVVTAGATASQKSSSQQEQQRGVDSGPSTLTHAEKIQRVSELARREHCIVLMTGATDYLSDGVRTATVSNGSHFLGKITGAGCALGAVIVSYAAVYPQDRFLATLAALLHYELAAENAEARTDLVRGPGSFIPAFLDELYLLGEEIKDGKGLAAKGALEARTKVELV